MTIFDNISGNNVLTQVWTLSWSDIVKYRAVHAFYISNTFCKQRQAKLLLFENYSNTSSSLSPKNNRIYSKKTSKGTSVFVFMRLYD